MLAEAGAEIEEAEPDLPDTSGAVRQAWSTALKLVVANTPEDRRPLLDAGLLRCRRLAGHYRDRVHARRRPCRTRPRNTMARLHQRYDLVLCPTVPAAPPLADAPTQDPARCFARSWAPWTFLFNMTRQPAISVPMGVGANGLPRSVQLAAALYRDDLVLRAARA